MFVSAVLILAAHFFLVSPAASEEQFPDNVAPSAASSGGAEGNTRGNKSDANVSATVSDVLVSVRELSGKPLHETATVKLYVREAAPLAEATGGNATATFANIAAGEYQIEVAAPGYKTANEHASVFPAGSEEKASTIYVYLRTKDEIARTNPDAALPIMTPRLQSEMDKGIEKMQKQQYEAAREQFNKAAKTAPGNPEVQYWLGLVEYAEKHYDAARAKFQTVLSIYPSHERALLALGELQLQTGDAVMAAATLERAYQTNGADWRTHLLLAKAYLQQRNFANALAHAKGAVALAKEHAGAAWMAVGQILAQQNRGEEAKQAFSKVIHNFPNDSVALEARVELADLSEKKPAPISAPKPRPEPNNSGATADPGISPIADQRWAPPDIDSKEYPAAQDAACSEEELVERTHATMIRQLGNFERFTATEHIEHRQVSGQGIPGPIHEKDFSYVVLVEYNKLGLPFLEEKRDGEDGVGSFPTRLATQGLFALALNVFSPTYKHDLDFKCEGLGVWRGQAAWRLRFEQLPDVAARLRIWRNEHGTYHVPLKGIVWISAASYDVLHLETDLREPMPALQLTRDHLIIDYGPVKFDHDGTILWLPWDADMYLEVRGKRYHHTHTLKNYMLFSVDTTYTVSNPKSVMAEERP